MDAAPTSVPTSLPSPAPSPAPHPAPMPAVRHRFQVPLAQTQGALALALLPRREPPRAAPSPRPGATVVPIDRRMRAAIEAWTRRYVQAAMEIVSGDRPASQLVRWSTAEVHRNLCRRAQIVARAGGHEPGVARVQQIRPRIASVHSCFVTDDVVECGVHLRYGERGRAVAARFERVDERWVCTALDFA